MESKYEVVAAIDARVQSDNSGHKRPRDEKGSQRIGESSDNKLVGHRHGKKSVNSKRKVTLPTHHSQPEA